MMKTLMAEIRDGKSKTNIETKQIKTDVEKLKEDTTEVKQQLEKLGKQKEVDNVYTATVREDLDAVENDNMRNVVIVKKLKTKQKMPNDRTELTKIIQKAGRNLVKEIIGSDESVVFVSQLYTGKDSIKIVEGSIPPFKIVFKSKQAGMEFKETPGQGRRALPERLHVHQLNGQVREQVGRQGQGRNTEASEETFPWSGSKDVHGD